MPRVDIWIRKKDMDSWNKISDKPSWISKHLAYEYIADYVVDKVNDPVAIKTREVIKKASPVLKTSWTLCKHGFSPEFCKHAKFVNGKKVCK